MAEQALPGSVTPRRTRGWAGRLNALIVQRLALPFDWGPNDCAAFAADAVLALHEHDTLAPLRVPRRTARQALRAVRAAGGPAVLSRCGLEPVSAGLAGVGDLVLVLQGRIYLLAVCNGMDALAPGTTGLVAHPMRRAVAAWRT